MSDSICTKLLSYLETDESDLKKKKKSPDSINPRILNNDSLRNKKSTVAMLEKYSSVNLRSPP